MHWLAHLPWHGMTRPSFIPPRPLRELQEFTRRRKQMIEVAAERNRATRGIGARPCEEENQQLTAALEATRCETRTAL